MRQQRDPTDAPTARTATVAAMAATATSHRRFRSLRACSSREICTSDAMIGSKNYPAHAHSTPSTVRRAGGGSKGTTHQKNVNRQRHALNQLNVPLDLALFLVAHLDSWKRAPSSNGTLTVGEKEFDSHQGRVQAMQPRLLRRAAGGSRRAPPPGPPNPCRTATALGWPTTRHPVLPTPSSMSLAVVRGHCWSALQCSRNHLDAVWTPTVGEQELRRHWVFSERKGWQWGFVYASVQECVARSFAGS